MHICTLFPILFAHMLIFCMSTNHSNVKSDTEISQVFLDEEAILFDHLAVDKYGRWVYIGAVNYLYQLSSDLKLQIKHTVTELDYPNCTACNSSHKLKRTESINRNKVLLLDRQNQELISCGSFFTDICHVHNVSDISDILHTRFEPAVRGEYDVLHVTFIAPNLLQNSSTPSSALYAGITDEFSLWSKPTITIRDLARKHFLSVPVQTPTSILETNSKDGGEKKFICGFSFRNRSYFLTSGIFARKLAYNSMYEQTKGAGHLIKIEYKSNKYLHDDVFITCNKSTENTWLSQRIQHAYIYEHVYKSNSESRTDSDKLEEKIMFAVFDLLLTDVGDESRVGFVVCKYDINKIYSSAQRSDTLNEDLIFLHEGDTRVTAMAVSSINNHTVLFFGTDNGHLHKVSIKGFNSPDVDAVNYYPDITIDKGFPINSDMLFDSTKNFLYVMTEKKLTKVKLHNCDKYNTSNTCLGAKDPYCGWCFPSDRCCLKTECADEENNTIWTSYDVHNYMNTSSSSGNNLSRPKGWNVSFMNNTMCSRYKSCSSCVSSTYQCKWHVNKHVCTNETIWHSNDIVIGDNLDQILSQSRNGTLYHKFPAHPFFCPQLFTNNESHIFYIHADMEKKNNIAVNYDIPTGLLETFISKNLDGGNTAQFTTMQNLHIFLNGYRSGLLQCNDVISTYADQKPNLTAELPVKPFETPKNIHIVLYRCAYEGHQCKKCQGVGYCKWHLGTRECKSDSLNSDDLEQFYKVKNCPDYAIFSFTPKWGPWEGGVRISINVTNLGKLLHSSLNIKVGHTPCTILHPHSTDETNEKLVCVVDRCNTTFRDCSGPIKLITEDLILESTNSFQFINPKINEIFPTNGPISGGTELTITGEYMNAGDVIEVYIGDLECVVFENYSTQLKCVTGPSKLSFKSNVTVKFDGYIRNSENIYEYDEQLESVGKINKVPRGVPTGGPNTLITFDISVQKNVTKQEEILFYVQDKELVKTYYSKCEILNISLVCPVPSIYHFHNYFLNERKPKLMDYGFKINTTNGLKVEDLNVPKKYPKFLLYPNSVGYLLQGNIVQDQTTSSIANLLRENIHLLIIGLIILAAFAVFIIYLRKSVEESRKMRRQINKMGMEMIAVSQWVKRVVIEKQIGLDENSSQMLKLPNVTIEYASVPRLPANETTQKIEYELPLDEKWEIPRENLVLGEFLGEGEFGRVVKGNVSGLLQQDIDTTVAVKMLKNIYTDADLVNLVMEMELMKLIGRHDNVLGLLGCCTLDGPLFIITEYSPHGNLLYFLRDRHHPSEALEISMDDLSEKVLITFAQQIARGMEYLASIKCVHRDLAARNILVFDDHIMKIADFGLARDIRGDYYYKQKTGGRFPVKWMAPEALTHRRYTPRSDVWSYGVLLWEIMTFGAVPYTTYDDAEKLLQDIQSGYRMRKPEDCSMEMYGLMRRCWKYLPEDRPDFTRIIQDLDAILVIEQSDSHCSNIDTESNHMPNETDSLLADTC